MSRISELPRRDWRSAAEPYVERLSALLRAPGGTQTLRLAQAAVLLETPAKRGSFVNGRVGIGKTFMLGLAPAMLRAERPLIMTLGGIKTETKNHLESLRANWKIPDDLLVLSYHEISNFPRKGKSLRDLWHGKGPDFIGADEMDKLANLGAAVTAQIHEWMTLEPDTTFLGVTGSCEHEGLLDFAHLADWSLRDGSPLPREPGDARIWSEVLDLGEMEKANWVCVDLGIPRGSRLETIRAAYRKRLHETPGFIVEDTPFTGVPLTFESHLLVAPEMEPHFERLRTLGERPDGADLLPDDPEADPDLEAVPDLCANGNIRETAVQLARGFCHLWEPLPPAEWRDARRAYFKHVRKSISRRDFLTEAQVRADAEQRRLPVWEHWRETAPTYQPQVKTHWFSSAAIDFAIRWGTEQPGVVWVDHPALGRAIEARSGWTYYGGRGLSSSGKYIEKAEPTTIVASRIANSIGRNLQYKWNRCLFMQTPGSSHWIEQGAGRFHREGQKKPVHCDFLIACSEDARAVLKILASARKTQQNIYSQKAANVPWKHVKTPNNLWAFR